ncbi:MAG TPA: 6,7-dimethyl-8-ribityllumazine synthase [Planctomycetota bacterium]|nr:6,7-dimethyl-8-ribityllumazine synthase [Planctomycetota bacterium]
MKEIQGQLDATGLRFAIVASRFNEIVVEPLVRGAVETLLRLGAEDDRITLLRVPGAFEIPGVAERAARSGQFDAVICLGAVIRGATPHFDWVAGEAARGIGRLAATAAIPVIFGVLTTDTLEQAIERAGSKAGNKGTDSAFAAVEMAQLYRKIAQWNGADHDR